ncbi:MAG TPA: STAS domain-containing protein [Actinomycetota bacterium]|nr:STAS domain-containing protein [Actinomycetota bacterium]
MKPEGKEPSIVIVIRGRVDRADIPRLCEDARSRLCASSGDVVLCDVAALSDPDVVVVDALARLQLTVRRLGRELEIRGASKELQELLALSGLSDVLPIEGG